MNQEDQTPHIGALIRTELKRQGRTTVWFASQLGFTRENCYKIYRHSWIQTDTLVNISKILHHDFFKDMSNYLNL